MGTTYTLIKNLEQTNDIGMLLKKGILPFGIVTKKIYYEYYKRELSKKISSVQSLKNTAIEYQVSDMTIRRAIRFMET